MSAAATVAIHTIRALLRSQVGQHVADEGVGKNGKRIRGAPVWQSWHYSKHGRFPDWPYCWRRSVGSRLTITVSLSRLKGCFCHLQVLFSD